MNANELARILSDLAAQARDGRGIDLFGGGEACHIAYSVAFVGRPAIQSFQDALNRLSTDSTLRLHSQDTLCERLTTLLKQHIRSPIESFQVEAERFLAAHLAEPVLKWTTVRPIAGVTLGDARTLTLGPFEVMRWSALYDDLRATGRFPKIPPDMVFKDPVDFVALTVVEAREAKRAQELGDARLEKLVHVLRFMLADPRYQIGIFDYRGRATRSYLTYSQDMQVTHGNAWTGSSELVDLSDPFFRDRESGHERLWSLLAKDALSTLERRILWSVEWIGKGVHDSVPEDAFIQIMFAVEALLKIDEKSAIQPSVMAQICEACAWVLRDDPDSRIELERHLKALYAVRSALAHGGERNLGHRDLDDLTTLAKNLVERFLTKDPLASFSSPDQLRSWIQRKRYGASS